MDAAAWPPPLPEHTGIEVLAGPRWGQGAELSVGGHAEGFLEAPILWPAVRLDCNFRGAQAPVRAVLPSRAIGLSGRILGVGVGYRHVGFGAGLPGLPGDRSANVVTNVLGLGMTLGPVEAALGGQWGLGWLADSGTAMVLPADGEAHLGVSTWGIKLAIGVRGEALAFAGDLLGLPRAFRTEDLGGVAYTWGPYVQAGVAF